jgi:hypothetical protein
VRIAKTQGDEKALTVTRATAGEVEEYVKQRYAGASVASVEQAGTLDVGDKPLAQWRVKFTEPDARRVTLSKWGKLAAAVEADKLADQQSQDESLTQ